MDRDRIRPRLHHILDAIRAIERLCGGRTLSDFTSDPDLNAAVERYIERLSEASRQIPEALKQKHPRIDWRGVADIGNVLRHAYDQVVNEEIWDAVIQDLPSLKAAVEAMMREVGDDDG